MKASAWLSSRLLLVEFPAVATNVGGLPAAVVDGVTGLLVPPRDTAALAGALVRLAQHTKLRDLLANQAYERVRRDYSWDIQGAALVRLMRATICHQKLASLRVADGAANDALDQA